MKIGIDTRTLMDAQYSGVSEYTFSLIKEILRLASASSAQGAFSPKAEYEFRLFYNCFGDCPSMPDFAGSNVKTVKYNYPNKILNYLLFKFFNYPKIDKKLEADVFFMPHINFIGLSAGAKSLITVHDLSFLRYPEFFSARKNFWHRMINVKKLLNRFSRIVAVSENTKRDIVELAGVNPDKITVIYSGVDEKFRRISDISIDDKINLKAVKQKYGLPEKFILYLGTIEPRKNVDGIIRAYNQLRINNNELRNVKLAIAGSRGWKSNSIYQEWEKSEFKDDIKFLGYIDAKDKAYLYNSASVFIYPSFYEGFGLPPLEAMACGVPVVTSFASSLPEVAGEAALLVDPYSISDIARALTDVLTDGNLKSKLVARGLNRAREFSWQKTADEYIRILGNL